MTTGVSIGKHNGIHQWTLGQRCRIGGKDMPYYVFKTELDKNIIYVVSLVFFFFFIVNCFVIFLIFFRFLDEIIQHYFQNLLSHLNRTG